MSAAGLSRNLFCILRSIPTVVGIRHRGHGCGCGIHVRLVAIDVCIYTKYCCGGGGRCEKERAGEDIIKVIAWSLVWTHMLF